MGVVGIVNGVRYAYYQDACMFATWNEMRCDAHETRCDWLHRSINNGRCDSRPCHIPLSPTGFGFCRLFSLRVGPFACRLIVPCGWMRLVRGSTVRLLSPIAARHTLRMAKKGERRKRRTAKAMANDSTQHSCGGLVYSRMSLKFLLHILLVTALTMAGLLQPV